MRRTASLVLVGLTIAVLAGAGKPADAAQRGRHHRRPSVEAARPPGRADDDALYRHRGYGMGGPLLGGKSAEAGACAGFAFADPPRCGAAGYGIYGNGLGYGFGF